MAAAPYVATKGGIKEAVRGREMDVLRAIGIDCVHDKKRKCPYHDHGGENDWSWDDRKKLAICTCIGTRFIDNGKKAHDIYRVAMVLENRDFESTKIRIAELLGRADLIITKGGSSQKHDAESLLSAPVENRNDAVTPNYLGHRLGISVDVPKPVTRVIGLNSLAYFDPPPDGKGKPVLVANAPCAVFETIDRDGGIHALRIYTAPDGKGKADLGSGRDPKKSAIKLDPNEKINGRAVLWGNRETATVTIIAEGVETACAIAYAFSSELANGQYLVAACISDAGVAAFRPWPTTKKVIVGADRDEGLNEHGKERGRAGEKAAREFCTRHIENGLRTSIALPGVAGEKIDWLDILRRDGVDAVRNGIHAAVQFVPEPDELGQQAKGQQREDDLAEIAKTYPLPSLNGVIYYKHTQTGEIWAHKEIEKKDGPEVLPFATPFAISARLARVGGRKKAYSIRIAFQDRDGKPAEVDIECGALAAMGGRNVMVELLDAGIRTDNKGDQEVIQILKAFNPPSEILIVQQPGWHFDIPGCPDPVFVAPCGAVFGAPEAVRIELEASIRLRPEIARAGTLEGWQIGVRAAVTATNVPHWTLGVCGIFAGVILSLIRMASCGVNISGHTSGGKTLTQEIAASGWSTPDKHRPGSLLQMANNTENSIELAAKRATATALNLDELRLVTGKILAGWIYMLAGGAGKKRMTVNVTMVETIVWSVFVLMSSEHSLADKIRGDGVEYDPGMSVRIVDINVDDFNRSVGAETLNAISGIHRNYGHAGIAFVRKLVERGDHRRAPGIHKSILEAADKLAGDGSDPAMKRAAIPFALLIIAGSMAKEFGIIPTETDVRGAIKALWDRFQQSAEAEVLEPETLMVRNLASWTARGWGVSIKPTSEGTGINNRDTWAWYDENAVYIPKDRIQQAAGNAMKESQIGAALNRMELLADQAPDRFYVRFVPQTGRVDAYALKRERFGRSEHDRDIDNIDDVISGTSDRAAEPKPMSLRQLARAGRLELRRQGDRLWAEIDRGMQVTISQTARAALKALGVSETPVTWPPIANEATGND